MEEIKYYFFSFFHVIMLSDLPLKCHKINLKMMLQIRMILLSQHLKLFCLLSSKYGCFRNHLAEALEQYRKNQTQAFRGRGREGDERRYLNWRVKRKINQFYEILDRDFQLLDIKKC